MQVKYKFCETVFTSRIICHFCIALRRRVESRGVEHRSIDFLFFSSSSSLWLLFLFSCNSLILLLNLKHAVNFGSAQKLQKIHDSRSVVRSASMCIKMLCFTQASSCGVYSFINIHIAYASRLCCLLADNLDAYFAHVHQLLAAESLLSISEKEIKMTMLCLKPSPLGFQ